MSAPSYERVKFWVDVCAVSRRELASISDRLNLLLDKDRAYIGNVCMMAHNGTISGCGSLTKFIHGENLHSEYRNDVFTLFMDIDELMESLRTPTQQMWKIKTTSKQRKRTSCE